MMGVILRFSGCGLIILSSIVMGEGCMVTLSPPALATMVRNCEAYGLSEVELRELWADLSLPEAGFADNARTKVKEYSAQGVDLVPFLLELQQFGAELEQKAGISQSAVMLWLALSHDERATAHLLATFHELVRTRDDLNLLARVIYCLSLTKSEAAADLLFEVQSDEFWRDDTASDGMKLEEYEDSSDPDEEAFISGVRKEALRTLADTGSDRAIYAFATHDGIHQTLVSFADRLFRVAIESKDTLPDVEKWHEKGLPERKLAEMRALVQWWQNAEAQGVVLPYAKMLLHDLQRAAWEGPVRARIAYYRKNDVDIVPVLMHLEERHNLPETEDGAVDAIKESTIRFWIAMSGGEIAGEYLLNEVRELMKGSITTESQLDQLNGLISMLGMTRYEPAIDYLFEIQDNEFWESGGAPKIVRPASVRWSSEQEIEYAKERLKELALNALAFSGTEKAIHAFGTGEGINPAFHKRLNGLFENAARAHFNIIGVPEWYGYPLPEETLKGLQELFAKYGKTYVPKEESEKIKNMSIPHF
jgi:hypothetical protein